MAITRQNWRWTSREGCGLPGERIGARKARSALHCRRVPSGTSLIFLAQSLLAIAHTSSDSERVLRRPIESTPVMTSQFIVTKEHRRFAEFADAVRKQNTIGV
ncbi:hypothetical protein AB0M90_12465, partial [Micrococcus luteus]